MIGSGAIAFDISSSSSCDATSTYCPNQAENIVLSSATADFVAADNNMSPAVDAAAVAVADVGSTAPECCTCCGITQIQLLHCGLNIILNDGTF